MANPALKNDEAPSAAPAPRLKVLIVDANEDDRDYYRRILERSGEARFDIRGAVCACEGMGMCQTEGPFDCIILEYVLPDADGFDFIRTHKRIFGDTAAAIVMVTDRGTETTAAEALQIGAHDYLPKPAVLEGHFAPRLLHAVERARLKDQVRIYQAELEKVNAALLEFTHTASHDLKAPLTRIGYYCDLLKEEGGEALSGTCRGYIDRMQVNARRLTQLVDDLLTYSRTLHSQEAAEEVDAQALAAGVVEDLATQITAAEARIVTGALPRLTAYPLRLRQLFQNLIANAIKYRHPDRAPVVEVECISAGDFHKFFIRDNGLGIDEKYRDKIFRPFERLHAQDKIEGSGIGLATCRKVVEMHKGKIWVEENPGGGSVFCFTVKKEGYDG